MNVAPLGSLSFHTKSCQVLAFAHSITESDVLLNENASDNGDDEMTEDEIEARSRWLVAGSQDNRISIWELMDFSKSKQTQ